MRTFSDHRNFELYLLRFHGVDDIVDFQAFGTMSVLDLLPFEQCKITIENAYKQTS